MFAANNRAAAATTASSFQIKHRVGQHPAVLLPGEAGLHGGRDGEQRHGAGSRRLLWGREQTPGFKAS